MPDSLTTSATPKQVLLATDLSARCDRALDRAVQLTEAWQAELTAVNVLDLGGAPDQILAWTSGATDQDLRRIALQELRRNTEGVHVPIALRVERGSDPGAVIRRVAQEVRADVIVSSVARNEVLGRFLLGSTVEQLAGTVSQPMLVVRQRARKPYRHIVVASDLSPGAHEGLQVAARLFPGQPLELFHAHEMPLAGLSGRPTAGKAVTISAQQACEALLVQTPLPSDTSVHIHCERGAVTSALPAYVRQHEVDLVVLGVQPAGLVSTLLGSTALRLIQWLPCDVLLVHAS